jgi:predicted DNA-binding transcriptional regulator YafY
MRSPEPQQPCAVETAEVSVDEERVLHVLEDAANKQRVARINYWSASSPAGVPRWRYVSVQRLFASVPVRFVAICHEADKLKWYRADRVSAAHLDGESTFRQSAASELDEFVAASVDGFRGPGAPADCVFFVRDPEARWAVQNLPGAMQTSVIPGGVRVRTVTSAVIRLARFVVGLGDAARAETPELAAAVRELAEGALRAGARPGKLSARPAASA